MRTLSTALVAVALATLPAYAAESPATDCLIGIQNEDETTITTDQICTDGDACDTDGATNGTCVFRIRGIVNIPDVAGCTLQPMKKVKFKTKPKNPGGLIEITPVAGQATPFIGEVIDFAVPLKKQGKKPGNRKILASAKADVKPAAKDKDKVKFTCNVCPTDDCSGGPPVGECPTTCDNTAGGPDRLVLTIADNGTDLDNGWAGNSFNFPLVPGGKLDMCLSECDSSTDTVCTACGAIGPGTGSGVQFGAPLPLFANNVPVCVVSRWRESIRGTVDEATGETSLDVKLFSDVYLTDATSVCPQCNNGQCNSGARQGQSCTVEAANFPVFVSAGNIDNYNLSSQCVPSSPTATLNIDFLPLTSGQTDPLVGPTPCTRQPGTPIGVPVKSDDCGTSGCASTCTGNACVEQVPDPTNPGSTICKDSKGGLSQLCCNNNTNKPCHPLANGGTVIRTGSITAPQPPLPDATYPKSNSGVLASTFCIPATGTNTIDSVTGLPGPGIILLNGTGAWSKQ